MDPLTVPQLGPAEVRDHMADGALLVDVREAYEWEEVRIPGTTHIPMSQLQQRLQELPKDREIILQCAHGVRSQAAAVWLRHHGYEAGHLAGGLEAWESADLPVET